MAVEVAGLSIRLPQGDTGVIKFVAEKGEVTAEDRGVFTLARRDGTAILRKILPFDGDTAHMALTYEDTAGLKPGTYAWSLRVVRRGVFDGGKLTAVEGQHTAVLNGSLMLQAVAGGVR